MRNLPDSLIMRKAHNHRDDSDIIQDIKNSCEDPTHHLKSLHEGSMVFELPDTLHDAW